MFLAAAWWVGTDFPLTRPLLLFEAGDSEGLPTDDRWGWSGFGTGGSVRFERGAVLDTAEDMSWQNGWFRSLGRNLDRERGFTVVSDFELEAERHGIPNRAGLSVLILDKSAKGVEIGVWEDEVWVQTDDPLFKHGESVGWEGGEGELEVRFKGDLVTVSVNGRSFETAVKDYSAFRGFPDPYSSPNFLFWGDNTRAAGFLGSLQRVEILPD